MNYLELGSPDSPAVVFAHGWGRSHADFFAVAEALDDQIHAILLDLPGFGDTPRPADAWDTSDYAENVIHFLSHLGISKCIWVGHSFGGRIGLRIAVSNPEIIMGLTLVGSAGIPRKKNIKNKITSKMRSLLFKIEKKRAKSDLEIIALESRYGSVDYIESRSSGLRDIFLKTVNEDQSLALPKIISDTELIYGAQDTDTPPSLGRTIQNLIPNSNITIVPEMGHINILSRGRHIIALRIKELLEKNNP